MFTGTAKVEAPQFLHDHQNDSSLFMFERVAEVEIACIKDALHKTSGNKLQSAKLLRITRQRDAAISSFLFCGLG